MRHDNRSAADLSKIDRTALSHAEQVSYDMFKYQLADADSSYRYHEYLFPLNQLGGIQTVGDIATQSLRFEHFAQGLSGLGKTVAIIWSVYGSKPSALLQQG